MKPKRIGPLLSAVLPPGFDLMQQRLPQVQRFLEQSLPEPVNRSVTLMSLDRDQIVIAASSPTVANYLRLHGSEIQQQLRETLGLEQAVRFRSVPDALLRVERRQVLRQPRSVSAQSVAALERNAQWIEDETLRAAMLALARSLKQS